MFKGLPKDFESLPLEEKKKAMEELADNHFPRVFRRYGFPDINWRDHMEMNIVEEMDSVAWRAKTDIGQTIILKMTEEMTQMFGPSGVTKMEVV